ncbi:methyltransferase domain-containing protein [Halomonas sp. SL1]|uniref:methyltransferase domain-containing protein n=1 Tax=Halomonas sp. SL1 TaxID=2137478 RepID=UPI000D15C95A|nr:methyltransferase domain-containing protein [Halomonas sp. SL1]RAH37398.1 methyltransferase domain-containing protein [Halomonas sp. SL1]
MTAQPSHAIDIHTDQRDRNWRARVAHAFSRAAPHYRERARAQQAMAERLLERLPERAGAVLDLGCGPGDLAAELAKRFAADATIHGLDLAPGMLTEARRRHGETIDWLCADAADLPLPDGGLDLVVSNLAIQWCSDLDAVLAEVRRVLRPGGRALINTLAPGTLSEVGQAWQRPAALLGFHDAARHRRAVHAAGFRGVEVTERIERFHYPDLAAVMTSIKGVGAQVARDGARLSRADVARAARRFEALRNEDGLPVSYHLLTLDLER